MSSNYVGHLITETTNTLQHFATLHHTSLNYTSLHCNTSLHFTTLHSTTLHYTATLRYTSPHFTQLHFTTLQHFATLYHTSLNYTSLNLSTLPFHSFTLLYPFIWLNPSTFPIVPFHLTSLNLTQYISPIMPKYVKFRRDSHFTTFRIGSQLFRYITRFSFCFLL